MLEASLDVSSIAGGTFTPGERITGATSGAKGTILYIEGSDLLNIREDKGAFTQGETIDNGSGVTATVDVVTSDRLEYLAEANREIVRLSAVIPSEEQKELELLLAAHIACMKEPYPVSEREGDVSITLAKWGSHSSPFAARYEERIKRFRDPGPHILPRPVT